MYIYIDKISRFHKDLKKRHLIFEENNTIKLRVEYERVYNYVLNNLECNNLNDLNFLRFPEMDAPLP